MEVKFGYLIRIEDNWYFIVSCVCDIKTWTYTYYNDDTLFEYFCWLSSHGEYLNFTAIKHKIKVGEIIFIYASYNSPKIEEVRVADISDPF